VQIGEGLHIKLATSTPQPALRADLSQRER